ncbi:CheB methylesterase [Gloeothece citriformis PCC 7424]|uniref:protein-glutamate methylesterase n=1 Tax=Gloeothece citriformis (strain PCC 7424) TaxID=65393 RepID=B7KD78_GLOC7|nr:chemotaxis protein CheB [Gloeothece citriformis]ACK68898.1 CheB methylesterase [Gloeothece citriformis PCC 7424]
MNTINAQEGDEFPRHFPDTQFDIIAMAASAGGLKALSEVLSHLPSNFPAAIVIVQHLDPSSRSFMSQILTRRTTLEVKQAEEGDTLEPGSIYIAPPNYHVLVNSNGTLSLTQSKLVHFVRPSADLLFDSVAKSYKNRAIAVILSGTGKDGSVGIKTIQEMEGVVIVQDEKTSEYFGMPDAAIKTGKVDYIVPLDEIASLLLTLVTENDPKMR